VHEDTVELATYTRAVGGTDPHPNTVDQLIKKLDAQLDTVIEAAGNRGHVVGAEALQRTAHELVLLAQSLEGRADEHAEMLRSTVAAVLDGGSDDYDVVMDRIHGGAS
jgi:hypothetical protein